MGKAALLTQLVRNFNILHSVPFMPHSDKGYKMLLGEFLLANYKVQSWGILEGKGLEGCDGDQNNNRS